MEITKIFTFDAAHHLTDYHGKCEHVHGHTYKLEITVEGPVQSNGLVLDFTILKNIVKNNILDKVDHFDLNTILKNPSSENLVIWMWEQISPFQEKVLEESSNPNLPESLKGYLEDTNNLDVKVNQVSLKEIKLWETGSSCLIYKGN